jgi:polyhydroxyalkanoate synthase
MLTGRAARLTTWVVMDEWIAQYSTPDDRDEPAPAPKKSARKTAARKATPRKATPRKSASQTTKTAARTSKKASTSTTKTSPPPPTTTQPATTPPTSPTEVAPDRGAIGSNRARRFGSDASRNLAPKR